MICDMKTLMNLYLVIPASLTQNKIQMELNSNYWIAILAFFAFLVLVYIVLSPNKLKKIKYERWRENRMKL